jgi:hypothetical protein
MSKLQFVEKLAGISSCEAELGDDILINLITLYAICDQMQYRFPTAPWNVSL